MPEPRATQELETRLYHAVTGDDTATVRSLLAKQPQLRHAALPLGKSWLHQAAASDALAVAKLLVASGFGVDEPCGSNPETPLHYAAAKGHVKMARWLLDRGATVNAADNYGRTPLMNAARDGHADVLKLLLERGANPNATYGQPPQSALSVAVLYGHGHVIELLRAAGADEPRPNPKPGIASRARAKPTGARGGARRRSNRAAGTIPSLRERIIQHVAEALGPVQKLALIEVVPGTIELAINVVPPRKGRRFVTLFTTGMSQRPKRRVKGQDCPPYAELLVHLPADWPLTKAALKDPDNYWPIEWLRVIAHHVHDNGVCLADGDTLGNGEPPKPFAPGTKLSCGLLLENPKLEPLPADGRSHVHFYDVIPLYDQERMLYEAKGRKELLNRFQKRRITLEVNPKRENVARSTRR